MTETKTDELALMREVYDLIKLVAKNVDWMPHPHCTQVDDAVRALAPKVRLWLAQQEQTPFQDALKDHPHMAALHRADGGPSMADLAKGADAMLKALGLKLPEE